MQTSAICSTRSLPRSNDAWAALYRETFVKQDLDPDLDPEVLMTFMWAAELGLGVLEALAIDPPKPHALAKVVGRLVGSLRGGS